MDTVIFDIHNHYNYQEITDCECIICDNQRKSRAVEMANPEVFWLSSNTVMSDTCKRYRSDTSKRDLLSELSFVCSVSNDISKELTLDNIDFKTSFLIWIWNILIAEKPEDDDWWAINAPLISLSDWINMYRYMHHSCPNDYKYNKKLFKWLVK